jgi:hypothetical protein
MGGGVRLRCGQVEVEWRRVQAWASRGNEWGRRGSGGDGSVLVKQGRSCAWRWGLDTGRGLVALGPRWKMWAARGGKKNGPGPRRTVHFLFIRNISKRLELIQSKGVIPEF